MLTSVSRGYRLSSAKERDQSPINREATEKALEIKKKRRYKWFETGQS